jgi:large subunit ribosomal protein L21
VSDFLMQKAVISTGGKQYIVQKGDRLEVELVGEAKTLTFEPLLLFDDKNSKIGKPRVSGAKVAAKVVEDNVKDDKIKVQKFQAKKRVKKLRGHRQQHSVIEITSISEK